MVYQIKMISPAEREIIIQIAIKNSTKTEDFFDFRTSKFPLPVIRISIDVPIYRMENFRTFTDQKRYLSEMGRDNNFFQKGQEEESVQQVQHELLSRLAKKGKDGSITPVIDVLRENKQREPLLITSQGIVVNGNRRLAAMRELFNEGTTETQSFRYIDCMVLPTDASADEIRDIEASLQGKPETKLDYDWIGDAQLINSQVNIHKSISVVSKRLHRPERDIKNTLQALIEADLYLKEWADSEGDYTKVTDEAEQFFKDLPKNLEGKSTALATASRYIAWSLFDNRKELPSRIYDFNAAFGKLAEDVIDRFTNTLGISTESNHDDDDDGFDIDTGEDDGVISYQNVIDAIREDNEDNIKALIDAAQDAIEAAKGQKSGDAALKAINQAHSKLASVDLHKANLNTFPAIRKQLESITTVINKLSNTLSKLSPEEKE